MNPRLRPDVAGEDERLSWGRWDAAGHRTIYGSTSRVGIFLETLAPFKVPSIQPKAIELVDADSLDSQTPLDVGLMDLIRTEVYDLGCMLMWNIPATWRESRQVHEMQLPETEWLIDVDQSESIVSLRKGLSYDRLDLSDMKGPDRTLTTELAGWLWGQTLFDGSLPVGIKYASKFGLDHTCFAIWLRAIDDGKHHLSERVRQLVHDGIAKNDQDLVAAADALGLWIH